MLFRARISWPEFLLLTTLIVQCTASRADDSRIFEITPIGGYRFGGTFEFEGSDASYDVMDSSSSGLIFNLRDKANTQWELLYSSQSTKVQLRSGSGLRPSYGFDMHVLQIGGTYQGQGDIVRPYLAATIGGTRIETEGDDDHFFSASIGVGLQLRPTETLGFRLEARAYGSLTDSDTDLFCHTGPDLAVCAVRVEGNLIGQIDTFAGIVFRF